MKKCDVHIFRPAGILREGARFFAVRADGGGVRRGTGEGMLYGGVGFFFLTKFLKQIWIKYD